VFLATAMLAAGWAAVLWDTRFITAPAGPWDVLKYGFIGSYAFVTSMLIRRFFQSDLRPSAYASAVFRIMLVLLIVAVLHQVIGATSPLAYHAELATAFVVGFFPLVGLQALQRVTSKALYLIVPPVTSDYPLDQLDGFNLWYEARLIEEGVEDMQNLTTMNLVDVILHTRVPAGRLVDWIDQAFLLIHLEHADRDGLAGARQPQPCPAGAHPGAGPAAELVAEPGAQARVKLRRGRHPYRHRLAQGILGRAGPAARVAAQASFRQAAARGTAAAAEGAAPLARRRPRLRARPGSGLELAAQRGSGEPDLTSRAEAGRFRGRAPPGPRSGPPGLPRRGRGMRTRSRCTAGPVSSRKGRRVRQYRRASGELWDTIMMGLAL
jgi:hypothetical protein